MEDSTDLRNTTILSHSYMQGVERITGNTTKNNGEFKIHENVIEAREKSWLWLFEKFSEETNNLELNIKTLKPDTESSGSHSSEIRLPVRKTAAQIQYWLQTGKPPCQVTEAESSDSDVTVSISESEATDHDESEYLPSVSMIVQEKLENSGEKSIATGSSASSVDTAAYILNNTNATKKSCCASIEKDSCTSSFGNLDNNRIVRSINAVTPKVLLSRSMEFPKNCKVFDEMSATRTSMSADFNLKRNSRSKTMSPAKKTLNDGISDKNDEVLAVVSEPVEKRVKKDVKDSEVTVESKESGISSLATEIIKRVESNEEEKFLSPQKIIPVVEKSLLVRRRKLYTDSDSILDILSPKIKTTPTIRSRKSIHPALNSPYPVVKRKYIHRPRFLTNSGVRGRRRKTKTCTLDKSNLRTKWSRDKSSISNSKLLENLNVSLIDTLDKTTPTDSDKIIISNENKNLNNPVDVRTDADRGDDERRNQATLTLLSDVGAHSTLKLKDKRDEDSISNPDMLLLNNCETRIRSLGNSSLERLIHSGKFNPKVIVHDFLRLKNCCSQLERENNKNWLQKTNKIEILKTAEKEIDEKSPKIKTRHDNELKEPEEVTPKLSRREKKRSRSRRESRNCDTKILYTTKFDVDTDDSFSLQESHSYLRTNKTNDDVDHRITISGNESQAVETGTILTNSENVTVTFKNTSHDRGDSIFVLTSSDEEDIFKTLSTTSKLKSLRKKRAKKIEYTTESSNSFRKNMTTDDCPTLKSTKGFKDCYKIVSSSSEAEVDND